MTVKTTVLIERIDGVVQKYHTTEASLLARGYTTETSYYHDEERLTYIREEFLEEAEEEGPGPPIPEELWEIVVYTEYKEKKKARHDRYELRTVVRATSASEAIERGIGKMVSNVPDEHGSYLDALGIYGIESNEAAQRIPEGREYEGVKYYRHAVGTQRPSDATYTWKGGET